MLTRIKQWLEPPYFEGDEEITAQARVLNTLIINFGAGLLIFIFILIPFFAVQKIWGLTLLIPLFIGLVIGRALVFRRRVRLGSTLIILFSYVGFFSFALLSGGPNSPGMFFLSAVILITGFFLNVRAANILVILTVLIPLGVVFLENQGLIIPKIFVFKPLTGWFAFSIGLVFMNSAKNLILDNLESALAAVRQQNTLLQKTQQSLRESEERYKLMFESAPLAINITRGTEITYANPSYLKMFGFSNLDELKSFTPVDLFTPESRPQILENIQRRAKGLPVPNSYEAECFRKDGTRFPILMHLTRTMFTDGPATVGFILDVTERKEAEEQIWQSERKYRELFQVNKDGIAIFLLNPHGPPSTFVEINDAASAMLGYTREEMLKLTPVMLEPNVTREKFQIRQSEFESKGVANFETVLLHKNGSPVFTEFSAQLIQYEGQPAIMNIVRDITERKRHENELHAIAALSAALRTAETRAEMLPVIVEQMAALLNCDSASIEIIDPVTGDAIVEEAHGAWQSLVGSHQKNGSGMNAIISRTRQPYFTNDLANDTNLVYPEWAANAGIRAGAGVPLIAQEKLIGFVWMGRRTGIAESEVRLLASIADIAANAIYRATLHEQTQKDATNLALAYDTTLEGWVHALELRDQETEGHTRRVVQLTVDLARATGIREGELENIRRGALLHDIGKMGIPDSILLKPGTLDEREWEIMRQHPEYAYKLLEPIEYLRPVLDIPYFHHEKWDGTGYPHGLKGAEIPLAARIFAIVDVWDALTSARPYRPAWSKEKALAHIAEQSKKHFDPAVVETFLNIF